MKDKKRISIKKILLIILFVVIVFFVAGLWYLSVAIYDENFNQRFSSDESLMFNISDFDGLQRTQYKFASNKGQMLTGYMYSFGSGQRGIVVLAHGFGGGGHNSYMDCANYFARHGYYAFAYDATGNDESEGEGVGGLPQGVVDLDYAISFIEGSKDFGNLPIVLFGHSWGGYSVSSVLTYHPEVKAVIECSGFNKSSDMFESEGKNQAGNFIYVMLPFVKLHEFIKYGKYATNTAMDGFAASNVPVMIVHSEDDTIVPIEYGYNIYYDKYKDDSRFTFVHLETNGHNHVFASKAYDDYITELNANCKKWFESRDYDYNASENRDRYLADRASYIKENLDRSIWCNALDMEMFNRFVNFYDNALTR
ncbi:MAG: alpha/beta fold hydrolase [Spirochaetaceae bacterium]|nr:alpha/beta fold hydrolase [Spirochaetaceae bacterium]